MKRAQITHDYVTQEMNTEKQEYATQEVIMKSTNDDYLMKENAVANELASFRQKRADLKDLIQGISRDTHQLMKKRAELGELKVRYHTSFIFSIN